MILKGLRVQSLINVLIFFLVDGRDGNEGITGSPVVPFVLKPHFIQRIYIFIYIYLYIFISAHSHTHRHPMLTHPHAHTHTHKVFDRLSVFW